MTYDPLIFGKSDKEFIVSIEPNGETAEIFFEKDGKITSEFVPNRYWLLSNELLKGFVRLKGDLHYKFGKQFKDRDEWTNEKSHLKYRKNKDIYSIFNPAESLMVKDGYTSFKGMTPKDVSVLSFDIETTGLKHNNDSKLLIIANTFRKQGIVSRKLFAYDEYEDEGKMIEAWIEWVREVDPSILVNHNIFSFDIPYIKFIADKYNVSLDLGRNGSPLNFSTRASKKRIDGSRTQEYNNVRCYGREIVDTYFGLLSWDIGKKLESYGLKSAIKQLGLEVENRQHYDASTIKDNYKNPVEWEKIKNYARFDGDDALAIFDKIIPTTFYVAQSVPKSFQEIVLSASGSQINSMLVRAYLQQSHSIPKADNLEGVYVEGGISFGIPGIYNNTEKIDLKSAYPSQILRFKIYDKYKDPNAYFHYITKYFTEERFKIKEQAKVLKTEDLKARDDSAKAFINSMYGALNTSGLNFNNSILAAKITRETRQVITDTVQWLSGKNIEHWLGLAANE